MSFTLSQPKMMLLLLLSFLLYPNIRAQQTLFPPAVPLAVRSPYLSSWFHIKNGTILNHSLPATFDPSQILGWVVLLRVDGYTYSFFGNASTSPVVGGGALYEMENAMVTVTPTQTIVSAEAWDMQVNLTFLNPIEPGDWIKQSIPFSYIAFTAQSLSGTARRVQVYTSVSGEWSSGDRNQAIMWSATNSSDVVYHTVKLQTPALFNEVSNQAEWGNLYYATQIENITYKIAADNVSRSMFEAQGLLDNQVDTNFCAISAQLPVFAISCDLGTIQATQTPFVWAIGYTTDPAINYNDPSGNPMPKRSPYYKSKYSDDEALIVDFLNNFLNASSGAQQLDERIFNNATSVSDPLWDLVSLLIAQVYGSTQLTTGTDALGNLNKSDVMMFMKNIGGLAPNQVNAVEMLYSAFPAFMYIDPSLGALLLEPLFHLQASPNYLAPYAATDLGSSYPNVTSTNSSHNQGVEQSGNMLIMTYAHARATGDGSLISRYYALLTSWADYLTNSTLFIYDQTSADGLSVSNQTNLAIKGIIAIAAMSKMSSVVKHEADVSKYASAAAQLYSQWKSLALNNDQHLMAVYGQTSTWTLGYNLFADAWLGTNLVEPSVYNSHSRFLDNLTLASAFSDFGMPVDNLLSDTNAVISSWNLFVAAITQNGELCSHLISRVHNWASFNTSWEVFPLSYDSSQGSTIQGAASPAQGAMYAPLALKAPILAINANPYNSSGASPSHTGVIAGVIAADVVSIIMIIISVIVFNWRRRSRELKKSCGVLGGKVNESRPRSSDPPPLPSPPSPPGGGVFSPSSDSGIGSLPPPYHIPFATT